MEFLLVGACNAPPRFPSAELKEEYQGITSFSYSSKVEYVCRPGYMRNVNARNIFICGRNSRWHGTEQDICVREYILG